MAVPFIECLNSLFTYLIFKTFSFLCCRIIVYLLKITAPYKYEWLDDVFKEAGTFVFFFMTGYKFRPASNNPYFALRLDFCFLLHFSTCVS